LIEKRPMSDPREPWIAQAEESLPPESQVCRRNRAITATYARLYLRQRDLFKWAGMAAFASFQVGLALEPLEAGVGGGDLLDDLERVRETNNAVFADIAWAHFAYEAKGIDEVRRCLARTRGHHLLRSGFEQMHRAAQKGAIDRARAWEANTMLLEHEQFATVQPRFERFDRVFGHTLSLATMLDFDGNHRRIDRKSLSAFSLFMLTRGLHVLVFTGGVPNLISFDQRWHWIRHGLLPRWQRIDRAEQEVKRIMERFVTLGAP
jgi:hypothetical protein